MYKMNQSSGSYRIEPLRKDNYDTWVLQAGSILRRIGLWDYVSTTNLVARQQNLTILKVKKSSKNGKQTIKMLSLN
jgi:hypothetical protein